MSRPTSEDIPLTNRETQVLRHVALGLSNKEIGRSLDDQHRNGQRTRAEHPAQDRRHRPHASRRVGRAQGIGLSAHTGVVSCTRLAIARFDGELSSLRSQLARGCAARKRLAGPPC